MTRISRAALYLLLLPSHNFLQVRKFEHTLSLEDNEVSGNKSPTSSFHPPMQQATHNNSTTDEMMMMEHSVSLFMNHEFNSASAKQNKLSCDTVV